MVMVRQSMTFFTMNLTNLTNRMSLTVKTRLGTKNVFILSGGGKVSVSYCSTNECNLVKEKIIIYYYYFFS